MRVGQISQFYEFHTGKGSWLRWLRVRHDRSASLIPNHRLATWTSGFEIDIFDTRTCRPDLRLRFLPTVDRTL
ncbi:hypothetical protein T01_2247 [Trichinella spiralis]|uniref:Uncharacterized protein n=1 Tax=Trichinella spiralis TaxID=6334 RepID=A0A0V1B310_TRISP|nr:hypothetical protein T01_2247 [Trichinella spiralis]